MNEAINLALAGWFIVTSGGFACLWYSPEALHRVALRMRARARALRASQLAYWQAYAASYEDEVRAQALLVTDREMREAFNVR